MKFLSASVIAAIIAVSIPGSLAHGAGAPALAIDINGDSCVNDIDFQQLSLRYGESDTVSDINRDGSANYHDMAYLMAKWDENCTPQVATQPNIVFVLVDDMGLDMLKNLDGVEKLLGNQGTTFNNFFTPLARCCPSRASFFRGQYAHNHGVLTNNPDNGGSWETFYGLGDGPEKSTVATWLDDAGYNTMYAGKYMNWYASREYLPEIPDDHVPPGWDEWYGGKQGHYGQFDYTLIEKNSAGQVSQVDYGTDEEDYLTDVIRDKAMSFLTQSSQEPFFMTLSTISPHIGNYADDPDFPVTPAPRHENEFQDYQIDTSKPSFNEDLTDKPTWLRYRTNENGELVERPVIGQAGIDRFELEQRRGLQAMLSVEEMIDDILRELENSRRLKDTYIVFASDHGYHFGEHRLGAGKATIYEEDVKAPLIVRGPGVPANDERDHFIINNDIAPLFAEIGGATIPDFVDGTSFLPLLSASAPPADQWRKKLLLELWPDYIPERPVVSAARTRYHKFVRNVYGDGSIENELYTLTGDPYETTNKINDPGQQGNIPWLTTLLYQLETCSGDECRQLEFN